MTYNPLNDRALIDTCRYLLEHEPQSDFVRRVYPDVYALITASPDVQE